MKFNYGTALSLGTAVLLTVSGVSLTSTLAQATNTAAPSANAAATPGNATTDAGRPAPGNPQAEASPDPQQAGAGANAGAPGAPIAFPTAQVRRGTPLFNTNCSSCHGERLQGLLEAPALATKDFQSHWFGQPANNLYDYISQNMPQNAPGSLQPQEYADIMTFILSKNGIAPVDTAPELPGDSANLSTIVLPPAPAQ